MVIPHSLLAKIGRAIALASLASSVCYANAEQPYCVVRENGNMEAHVSQAAGKISVELQSVRETRSELEFWAAGVTEGSPKVLKQDLDQIYQPYSSNSKKKVMAADLDVSNNQLAGAAVEALLFSESPNFSIRVLHDGKVVCEHFCTEEKCTEDGYIYDNLPRWYRTFIFLK